MARGPAKGRNGQVLVSTWVTTELAERFRAWARNREGGTSAALREMIAEAIEEHEAGPGARPLPPPGLNPALGYRVGIRLRDAERLALLAAARERGTTPTHWLRSLALAHLAREPRWSTAELDTLRDVAAELRRIGAGVNAMARAVNTGARTGQHSPGQGETVREAAELVARQVRRVVGVMEGNLDYWGLPEAERPRASPRKRLAGASNSATKEAIAARAAQETPEPVPDILSPVGERVAAYAVRKALATLPPQTPEQVAELTAFARAGVLAREQRGDVLADPGEG